MRRLLVRPTNWNKPIDCVSRGSITGGSQADARARTPPRLGGLGLAGIQSGYLEEAAAGRLRPANAAALTPAAEIRTKSRRFRRASGPCITSSFTLLRIEGKDGPETASGGREHCRTFRTKSRPRPRPPRVLLFVDPHPSDGRRTISDGATQDAAGHVSQVGLGEQKDGPPGHPHSEHLV